MIVDLKPTGPHYMEDLFAAGGIGAVLRELRPLLHLDCLTVTGETLGERLAHGDGELCRSRRHPPARPSRCSARAGWSRLFGSLAPQGAILKRAAADPAFRARGPRGGVHLARGCGGAHRRSRARRDAGRFPGAAECRPDQPSGMPEAGYLPIPAKLARAGIKDMVRISDARMSGTAYGTVVLHVAPDAASGGPLARVQAATASGSASRTAASICWCRPTSWRAARSPPRHRPARGYARLYHDEICRPTTAAISISCARSRGGSRWMIPLRPSGRRGRTFPA